MTDDTKVIVGIVIRALRFAASLLEKFLKGEKIT